jgi:transposase-like protein
VTEQRYRAVLEVQSGLTVTEVADRFGVSRQAVHRWLRWYDELGLDGLADGSHRPRSHPAQTPPEVEARVCELRRDHPRWGQHRLHFELGRLGCPGPIPSLSTLYRILVRHGLIDPAPRGRKREDYRRWELPKSGPRIAMPVCRSATTPRSIPSSCSSLWRSSAELKMTDASLAS